MKLLILILILAALPSFAADVELLGVTKVDSIIFPDSTIQTTASTQGPQGPAGPSGAPGHSPELVWSGDQIAIDGFIFGPHLTGPQGVPGEPAPVAPERILYINRLLISDFVPVWFTQGNTWTVFNPVFSLNFQKLTDSSILRVEWSDNVGIYGPSWCNIGLFIDDSITTQCTGSWSGVPGTTIFNQQNVHCVIPDILSGLHKIEVKHRSQYCVYGNYAFDSSGSNRFISVEEQN